MGQKGVVGDHVSLATWIWVIEGYVVDEESHSWIRSVEENLGCRMVLSCVGRLVFGLFEEDVGGL